MSHADGSRDPQDPQRLLPRRLGRRLGTRLSLRGQLVALTALASTVTVVVLGVVVQWLLSTTTRDTVEQVLNDRAEALVSSILQTSPGRRIVVPSARLDADVAVFDADGRVVAGAVPDALAEEYQDLSRVRSGRTVAVGDYARVHALGLSTAGGTRGTVVLSERLAPYQEDSELALEVTAAAGVLLVAAATGLVAYASRRVLAPVALMARTAEEWGEHDLGRRFDLHGPRNEITDLGHTLDLLLEKVSAAIRSEQRLTSELAHELRTPLTAVQGNADLLLLNPSLDDEARSDLEDLRTSCRRMATTISALLDLARGTATTGDGETSRVRDVVEEVVTELHLDRSRPDLALVDRVATDAAWRVPHPLAARALAPLLANAGRFAATAVRVRTEADAGTTSVLVEDDGPGVGPGEREQIFAPGHTDGDGAGLGLALSRRVARSTGGDVTLDEPTAGGGTVFRLTLPSATQRQEQ